jgi:hypothetical protein
MFRKNITAINKDLERTGKAIISLGCSFVEGQGAVNDEMYSEYQWDFIKLGTPLQLNANEKTQKDILARYPIVGKGPDGKLDFTFMEQDNAFVNVLCKKYFQGEYTPINLGMRGKGNRATIKELSMNPDIDWHKIKEAVVIFAPSGPERLDFVNDEYMDHGGRWECIWPHYEGADGAKKILWEGYSKLLWSEKFGAIEQIGHMQELKLWCKAFNAKLVVVPAFDHRYTKEHFKESLTSKVIRNNERVFTREEKNGSKDSNALKLIDLWPWESVFNPAGQPTFIDAVLTKEFPHPEEHKLHHFWEYLGKGSPNGWVTSCAHPAAKGHDFFASLLYDHIRTL